MKMARHVNQIDERTQRISNQSYAGDIVSSKWLNKSQVTRWWLSKKIYCWLMFITWKYPSDSMFDSFANLKCRRNISKFCECVEFYWICGFVQVLVTFDRVHLMRMEKICIYLCWFLCIFVSCKCIYSAHSTVLTAIIIIEFAFKVWPQSVCKSIHSSLHFHSKMYNCSHFRRISPNLLSLEDTIATDSGQFCKCKRDDKPWMSKITKIHEKNWNNSNQLM